MSSLLDGLLLDPYRDPREVWIALRTDGQKGSGTSTDPFDGSETAGPPLIGFLTLKWNEFVVELGDIAANLPNFDVVNSKLRFEGVTGPAKDWFNYSASGSEFGIVEVTRYQTNSGQPSAQGFIVAPVSPAAGYPAAPPNVQFTWNGYITAKYTYTDQNGQPAVGPTFTLGARIVWPVAKVAFSTAHGLVNFDAVELTGFDGANSHFNGTYDLAGRTDNSVRIRLSDRFPDPPGTDIAAPLPCVVRKLAYRFDEIMRTAPEYALIHLGPGIFKTRGFAPAYISSQNDYREMFVGFVLRFGQRVCGSGLGASVLQLALAVDELRTTVAIGNPSTHSADFAQVTDLAIDCNAPGQPVSYGIFPAPVACGAVNLGGSFIALRRVRAINFCTQGVAECFVLGLVGETNPITPGSYLPTGTFNVIEDCILEQPGENNTHETTLVSVLGDNYGRGVSPVVRRNFVNCEYSGGSTENVAVEAYSREGDHHFKVTTKRPHNRAVGQNIRLNAATLPNEPNPIPPFYFFDDTFEITEVISSVELKCYSPSVLPTEIPTKGYIGVDFHGPAAQAGTGCVTESNALYDCLNAFYTDTGSTRDAVVRDNYYANISRAVYFSFYPNGGGVSAAQAAKSLTRSVVNGEFIATFEIADGTPLLDVSVNDAVTVTGARIGGLSEPAAPFNGTFSVLSVSGDRKSFSYLMKSDPTNNADPPSDQNPIRFQSRWQVRRFIYERNICDFYAFDAKTALAPFGVTVFGYLNGPPYMFPQSVYRDNLFRLIDGTPAVARANGQPTLAFNLYGSEDALLESNAIGITDPYVMLYSKGRNVNMFNNLNHSGKAVPATEDTSGFFSTFEGRTTLDDKIDEALVLSVL